MINFKIEKWFILAHILGGFDPRLLVPIAFGACREAAHHSRECAVGQGCSLFGWKVKKRKRKRLWSHNSPTTRYTPMTWRPPTRPNLFKGSTTFQKPHSVDLTLTHRSLGDFPGPNGSHPFTFVIWQSIVNKHPFLHISPHLFMGSFIYSRWKQLMDSYFIP